MNNNIRAKILIVIGVISIVLSIFCFGYGDLKFEPRSMYGGDAYTGIQNAAAVTSENVMILAKIVKWVAIPSSRGIFLNQGSTLISCIAGRFFTVLATREAHSL